MRIPVGILLVLVLLPLGSARAVPFIRGDSDQNGTVDIADAIHTFGFLFSAVDSDSICVSAFDTNDDGSVDVSDAIWILLFLFVDGALAPRAPFPDCGEDPTPDELDCVAFPPCELPPDTTAPEIEILVPENLSLFNTGLITVSGTVDDETAAVLVNGVEATVTPGDPPEFSAEVPLKEGKNVISATATDAEGNVGLAVIQVTLDTTPPNVQIEVPRDGAVLTSTGVDVAGLVNDMLTGTTIMQDDVIVTVNGVRAEVTNRSFVVSNLLLQRGANTISVEAMDRAGNTAGVSTRVTVQDQAGQRVLMISGNNQSAPIGNQLVTPLVVALVDGNGIPLAERFVKFEVTRGDGTLSAFPAQGNQLTVETDDQGLARVLFTVGKRSGAGNQRVTATAAGFQGEVVFCVNALPGPIQQITAVSGNNQQGVAGEPLPLPFVVFVMDAGANPIEGVEVIFEAVEGGGTFEGTPSVTWVTNSDGQTAAVLTLALQEGIQNNVVVASVAGSRESGITFVASGRLPGRIDDTSLSGIVLDMSDQPIPGATVSVEDTDIEATTDEEGQFAISGQGIRVGSIVLHVDGSTSPRPESFPSLEFDLTVVSGQDNTVGMPIRLPALDTEASMIVGGPEDVTVNMTNVPGLALTVFAGSATFLDGSKTGRLTITQVNLEKVPMPPPNGSVFMPPAWTIQPAGVRFDPPARITIPNDGFPPGAVIDIFQFDHDLNDFVGVGTATVVRDGSIFVSDPGFGITKAGWGGCGTPTPPCTAVCSPFKGCPEAPECFQFVVETFGRCNCKRCKRVPANGAPCDDGDPCTSNDRCQNGSCQGDRLVDIEITVNGKAPNEDDVIEESFCLDGRDVGSPTYAVSITPTPDPLLEISWDFVANGATATTSTGNNSGTEKQFTFSSPVTRNDESPFPPSPPIEFAIRVRVAEGQCATTREVRVRLFVVRLTVSSDETGANNFLPPFETTDGTRIAPLNRFRFLVGGTVGGAPRMITFRLEEAAAIPGPLSYAVTTLTGGVPAMPNSGMLTAGQASFTPQATNANRAIAGVARPSVSYRVEIRNSSNQLICSEVIAQDLTDRMRQEYVDSAMIFGNGFLMGGVGLDDNAPPRGQVGPAPSVALGGPTRTGTCRNWPGPNFVNPATGIGVVWDQGFSDLYEEISAAMGQTVCLHSGHRSPTHNRRVGGVLKSDHQWGRATDMSYPGPQAATVANAKFNLRLYQAALNKTAGQVLLELGAAQRLPCRWNPPPATHVFQIAGTPTRSVTVEDGNRDGLPDQVSKVSIPNIPSATNLSWNDSGGTSNPPFRIQDSNNNMVIDVGETLLLIHDGQHSLFERFSGASHVHAEAN